MSTEEILKLVDAGFTKDEILAMGSQQSATPETPKEEQPDDIKQPAENPKPQPAPEAPKIELTQEQLNQLIQGIAVKTASGSIEMPKSIDDTLKEHLTAILKGE